LLDLRVWLAQALLSTALALIVLASAALDEVEDVTGEGEEAGPVRAV